MKSNDELNEIDIDNSMCCYFDDRIRVVHVFIKFISKYFDLWHFLQNVYGAKPLSITFDNIDGFIKICDGTRYLVLFGPERHDAIYDSIKYIISEKGGITYIISHNFAKIKGDPYDSLPLEKTMTFHDVIILIKSVFNKDKNNY